MSRLTDYLPSWVFFTSTCLSLRLLLRISSIKLLLTESMLTLALGGARRGGGGGGGGGGRFIIVLRETSSSNSTSSFLIYLWAYWIFCWRSLLNSCSACLLAWFSTVSSMMMPMTSLLARSSFESLRESKTSCHSGGTFELLKVPSWRLNEIEVFFLNEIISDSCRNSSSSVFSPKKFLILPRKLFPSSFFLRVYSFFFLVSSYSSSEGQFELILSFITSPSSLVRNWKAMLPRR